MGTIQNTLSYVHVIFGFAGLLAFWIPVFAKKGGNTHVRYGKVFQWCAYTVLASAGVAIVLRTTDAIQQGYGPADKPVLFAFMVFLGYLTYVTFVIVRHAVGLVRTKQNPDDLKTPLNMILAVGSIIASVLLVGYALIFEPPIKIILFALSPIGFLTGIGNLRYLTGHRISRHAWLYEHLGAMLGAGIAFHTAFAVFGANQLFDLGLSGWVQVIPWITPALIGIPASFVWTRVYQKRFGDLPATA